MYIYIYIYTCSRYMIFRISDCFHDESWFSMVSFYFHEDELSIFWDQAWRLCGQGLMTISEVSSRESPPTQERVRKPGSSDDDDGGHNGWLILWNIPWKYGWWWWWWWWWFFWVNSNGTILTFEANCKRKSRNGYPLDDELWGHSAILTFEPKSNG